MFRNFSTKPAHVDDFADVADVADVDDVDDVADVTNIADVDDVMKSKLEEAGWLRCRCWRGSNARRPQLHLKMVLIPC